MKSYTILANYYDRLMGDFDYNGYLSYISKYCKNIGLDMCCGTGRMTRALAEKCTFITGVDSSETMLNIASEKGRGINNNLVYVLEDASKYICKNYYDFCTCVCDGFNYLTDKKMIMTINNIKKSLKIGGYLIFDVSSIYKLKELIGNNVFYEDYEDLTYLWTNSFRKNRVEMDLTFFTIQSNGMYSREDEHHTQFARDKETILKMLEGFKVKVVDGENYKTLKEKSKRLLFICKKVKE